MKKLILLLISISLFSCNKDDAAPTPEIEEKIFEGYVSLLTQEEVDEFASKDYTKINGFLKIGNSQESNSSIKDLSGLIKLNSVEGFMQIANNISLTSLVGLSNIKEVKKGGLSIYNNPALTNLNGLEGLIRVEGDVRIKKNDLLVSLIGLDNLESISKSFEIWDNYKLQNLDGLENLFSIGESFTLYYDYELENVNGLKSLSSIGKNLHFRLNRSLMNLDGLINLIHIGDELKISNNSDGSLTSISGLKNLKADELNIKIIGTELSDFDGLNGLTRVFALNIQNNRLLKSFNGLNGVSYVRSDVFIHNCSLIETLDGLNNLSFIVDNLTIQYNSNLINIDALTQITSINGDLKIVNNKVLNDLCGLKTVINNGLVGEYTVEENAYNPSIQDIAASNCSQ